MKKTSIKVIIIAIIFFAFLFLAKSNSFGAINRYTNYGDFIEKIDDLKEGDTFYGGSESEVFNNNKIFCIEQGEQYFQYPSYKYTCKKIISISDTSNSIYQPLAYIAHNAKTIHTSTGIREYFNNRYQIAFWAYEAAFEEDLGNEFSISNYRYVRDGKNIKLPKNGSYTNLQTIYGPAAIIKGTASTNQWYGCYSTENVYPYKYPAQSACDVYVEAINNCKRIYRTNAYFYKPRFSKFCNF